MDWMPRAHAGAKRLFARSPATGPKYGAARPAPSAGARRDDAVPFLRRDSRELGFWGGESEAERAAAGFAPTTPIIGRRRVAETAAAYRAAVAEAG
jgi:hypothetical protein